MNSEPSNPIEHAGASLALDELLNSVATLGLAPAEQLAAVRQSCLAKPTATASNAATELVERKLITRFQAQCLLAGRGHECVLGGRYQIQEKLGTGGMGVVYRAHDTKLARSVAIKVLPASSVPSADAVARFQREARALARLSHPAIVQAFDSGIDGERNFLVMEFIAGTDLGSRLREQGPILPAAAADYAYQAALGLQHAHERGLVHRDLKPGNLLVTQAGTVKILDLGLARFFQDQAGDSTLTREGFGMGTPDYMPPEQFHNAHQADARADVYALGCTLYHLVTGQVPFPTSSLSEKFDAHERRTPRDVEELCPQIPAGLALVIGRMLQKRPEDRFQSAREAAEALAPYIAGSSTSARSLKETVGWQGSMLALSVDGMQARKRRKLLRVAGIGAAFLVVAGLSVWIGGQIAGARRQLAALPAGNSSAPGASSGALAPAQEPAAAEPQVPRDPNVLTVARDGTAQFRTITEALEQVKPGMTILVQDDAVYEEGCSIGKPEAHRGITLEAVKRATISATRGGMAAITVGGPSNVTIRGFRLRADVAKATLVAVTNRAPGLRLQDLELRAGSASDYDGITLMGCDLLQTDAPVLIENCRCYDAQIGVLLLAIENDYQTARPVSRVILRENWFRNISGFGIALRGAARQIQIVGNVFDQNLGLASIQFDRLLQEADEILVANNTFHESAIAFRLWDGDVSRRRIEFANNLMLRSQSMDMLFIDSGGQLTEMKGPGDGARLPDQWQFRCNWRETTPPHAQFPMAKAWIPPSANDVMQAEIKLASRAAGDPRYLLPEADSPLAKSGAGANDASLPAYIGAFPPEGQEPWNWQTTWEARHPKMLRTVSKDPGDGGEYRTISEALADLPRPGMTVRVVDSAEYHEAIVISIAQNHERLTLESSARATLVTTAPKWGLIVRNIRGVTLRGFRMTTKTSTSSLLAIAGRCDNLLMEGIEFVGNPSVVGIQFESMAIADRSAAVRLENCTFRNLSVGVAVLGHHLSTRAPLPIEGVMIRGNRFRDCELHGIAVLGRINAVSIVENRIFTRGECCISATDLHSGSGDILIANNALSNAEKCILVENQSAAVPRFRIVNNLVCCQTGPDLAMRNTDAKAVAEWTIANNYRQVSLPASADERKLWLDAGRDRFGQPLAPLSLDPASPEFLLPPPTADLSVPDPGEELPPYIGPVPPAGVPRWNWE